MKALDIVEQIRQESPALFGGMPDKKAVRLVREILTYVAKQVDSAEEGKLSIPHLGTFRVRHVERDKDGEKTSVKKIGFKPGKIKAVSEAEAEVEPEEVVSDEDEDFDEE